MTVRLKNDRLIRALLRRPVEVTPIWIMRQAGRYLPEYREVRRKAGSFLVMCKTPELACEITLQPIRRFDLDAAIIFSDILTIPDAMGLGLEMVEGTGPVFTNPVRSDSDIRKLAVPDPEADLRYVMDAVRLTRRELDGKVPLIGFSGSPWTLATYMIEGGGSKDFALAKSLLYREPRSLHHLLETLARAVTDYLNAQIAAGAQIVMIFDTWGGILSKETYLEFSLAYMERIVAGLKREADGERIPVILFSKGAGAWVEEIAGSGCDGVGLDWMVDIGDVRRRVGDRVALQGNLDPSVLYASPETIRDEARKVLAGFGKGSGHVFNLGHGIHPGISPDHVKVLIDAVHELSREFHL